MWVAALKLFEKSLIIIFLFDRKETLFYIVI